MSTTTPPKGRNLPLVHVIYPRIGGRGLHETQAFRYRPYMLFILGALARREGWRVRLIDENNPRTLPPPDERPDLVAVTVWTRFAPRAYQICQTWRARGVLTVVGGVHPSIAVSEALRYADAVVAGEAESVIAEVLNDALAGNLKRVYRGEWLEMDVVPHARDFADLAAQRAFWGAPLQSYQSTRGCRYNCEFCSVIRINRRGQRHIPPERVVEELRIISKLPPRLPIRTPVYFHDDDMASDPEYLASLCEAMIRAKLKITWSAQVSIALARNEELLDLATRAGLDSVFIGFESMSRESLVEANKKNRPHEYAELIARLHSRRVNVRGGIVLGFDHDGPDVFEQTAEAAHRIGIDVMHATILTPLPGTGTFARMYDEGRIVDFNWENYDVYHAVFEPARMSRQQLAEGLVTTYQAFYGKSRRLQRLLRGLRYQRPVTYASSVMTNALYGRAYRGPVPPSTTEFWADPADVEEIAAASRADANAAINVAIDLATGNSRAGSPDSRTRTPVVFRAARPA
ncbi:MAG: B12-binding domain-containing radical SAM protein [Acidimicrobiales bacterium]|nr:B12-binding domain-containing radical SAM protein [Acidimicrobiales bacterium]